MLEPAPISQIYKRSKTAQPHQSAQFFFCTKHISGDCLSSIPDQCQGYAHNGCLPSQPILYKVVRLNELVLDQIFDPRWCRQEYQNNPLRLTPNNLFKILRAHSSQVYDPIPSKPPYSTLPCSVDCPVRPQEMPHDHGVIPKARSTYPDAHALSFNSGKNAVL